MELNAHDELAMSALEDFEEDPLIDGDLLSSLESEIAHLATTVPAWRGHCQGGMDKLPDDVILRIMRNLTLRKLDSTLRQLDSASAKLRRTADPVWQASCRKAKWRGGPGKVWSQLPSGYGEVVVPILPGCGTLAWRQMFRRCARHEDSIIVIDIGSVACQIGFSGDTAPDATLRYAPGDSPVQSDGKYTSDGEVSTHLTTLPCAQMCFCSCCTVPLKQPLTL